MYFGENVQLTGLELADAELILENWNNLELRLYLGSSTPASLEEEQEWIRNTWKMRSSGKGLEFAIRTFDGGFLGTCGVVRINQINRSGLLGIAIHSKQFWGKGYGTDAMCTLLAISFQILNLNRLELEVHSFNDRAIKSYKKIGFNEIGKRRQEHWINGKYYDSIIMDILREEFQTKFGMVDLTLKTIWNFSKT
jgi:RimJ/RimL family protein N-acetyltransferase